MSEPVTDKVIERVARALFMNGHPSMPWSKAPNGTKDLWRDDARVAIAAMEGGLQDIQTALEESVKLQSHYAALLNQHDGGARLQFANGDRWMARLRVTGHLK